MVINAVFIYCVHNFRAIIFLLATDNTTNVEQFIRLTVFEKTLIGQRTNIKRAVRYDRGRTTAERAEDGFPDAPTPAQLGWQGRKRRAGFVCVWKSITGNVAAASVVVASRVKEKLRE